MRKLSRKEQVVTLKRLAHLLSFGVPVVKALKTAKLNEVVVESVNSGTSLASSMSPYFDKEAANIIGACEFCGKTQQGLSLASDYLEKDGNIRKKIIGSLIYPAAVLAASMISLVFFLLYVFPQMIEFSRQMDVEAPAHILAIYSLARLFPYLLAVLALAAGLGFYLFMFEKYRIKIERLKLRLPLFGRIGKKLACSKIARMLYYMLNSGEPLSLALQKTSSAMNSPVFKDSVNALVKNVEEGQSLSCALQLDKNFDDELVFAAKVGEETGCTANMLEGIACLLEEDAYDLIKKAVSFIEPAATLASGAAVAFIAISVFSPITKILASIQ
jgi:type II secretory pathway component PulF